MGCYLKTKDEDIFLKSVDGITGKLEFTNNIDEAKKYPGDWYATTELQYLKFHFPEYNEKYLDKMSYHFT